MNDNEIGRDRSNAVFRPFFQHLIKKSAFSFGDTFYFGFFVQEFHRCGETFGRDLFKLSFSLCVGLLFDFLFRARDCVFIIFNLGAVCFRPAARRHRR